jgi:hypothetical protein
MKNKASSVEKVGNKGIRNDINIDILRPIKLDVSEKENKA